MVDAPSSPTLAAVVDGSERRRAIQGILADKSLTDLERRLRVQRLMDGTSSSNNNDTRNGDGATATINVTMPATEITTSMTSWGGLGLGTTLATSSSSTTTTMASRVLSVGGAADDDAKKSGGDEEGGMGDNSVCPPCVHYVGKCEIFAPCCGRPYGCRLCHDEMSPSCGTMDRFGVSEVRCSICKLRQSSKTNECSRCRVRFAEYHCMTCNIWTSLDKMPFHCDICGLCRVGGRENYRHCVTCCMCMSVGVYDTHVCMPEKYKNNCPVCREDMFSSRQPPQDLPCGHAIHVNCFRNLARYDGRCPICKKTVLSDESTRAAWSARARDIRLQPMPPDLARVVDVLCNDCGNRSMNLGWHFLGVQCLGCDSFNTVVEGGASPERVEG